MNNLNETTTINPLSFDTLPISKEVRRAVTEMGFEEPTHIQAMSIPLLLEGKDIIGQSQTGTGKTAAFGIPIIERISKQLAHKTQALILCPTRELAIQSCEEIRKYAKYKHSIKVVPIYGGQHIDRQIGSLKSGAEIVIGTPGRVMDHLRRRTLKLDHLTMLVLDEADEMLNMGFREDIETILKDVPAQRQTVLFSATMSDEIMEIAHEYLTNPEIVKLKKTELTVPNIRQYYFEVPSGKKVETLARLLDFYNPNRSIIFCNTKKMVDELADELQFRGYLPDALHGDMKQQARTTVMNAFKAGKVDILIATDVAARGIDVDDVDVVFNYDLPQDVEYYIHRIGRTGRAGKSGAAYTFVSGRYQLRELAEIESIIKKKIEHKKIPTLSEINEIKSEKLVDTILEALAKNHYGKYARIVDKLIDAEYTTVDIACAALSLLNENENNADDAQLDELITQQERKARKQAFKQEHQKPKDGKSKEPKWKKFVMPEEAQAVKFVIDIGHNDKVTAKNIISAITYEAKVSPKVIGNIVLHATHSIVEIEGGAADKVQFGMKNAMIKGKKVSVKKKRSKKKEK